MLRFGPDFTSAAGQGGSCCPTHSPQLAYGRPSVRIGARSEGQEGSIMRIGVMIGDGGPAPTIENLVDHVRRAESDGLHTAWCAHIFGLDAMTVLAVAGRETTRIELGTAVVP